MLSRGSFSTVHRYPGPTPKSQTPSDLHVCQISDVMLRQPLHVEAELHHVAVLHHVVLALHAGLALGAGLGDRARLDQVVEGDDLGLDEALLEVGVDDAGRLGGGGALLDGPGAGLLGAGRQVGLQAEGVEADAGEGGQAGLLLADGLEELQRLLLVELGEVGLQLGVEEDRLGGGDQGALLVLEGVVGQLVLVDVEDVEEGLGGEQVQLVQELRLLAALGDARGEEGVGPVSRISLASSTAVDLRLLCPS